jgi:hypothetical protein
MQKVAEAGLELEAQRDLHRAQLIAQEVSKIFG